MFTIRTAEISEHAGIVSDGFVRGYVGDNTPSTAVYTSIEGPETIGAFNLDLAGGSVDFTDYHVEAISGVPNSFLPWGSNVTFSIGDCLYVSSAEPVTQARFTIDTGAAWVSSFPGALDQLLIRDSTDGLTPNRTLVVSGDTSNGFRNTGTVTVDFAPGPVPSPALPRAVWTPVPGLIAPAQWICISPNGYVSSTVSPKMSMTYLLGNTNDHVNVTAIFNAPMSNGTFASFPDVVYYPGAEMIFSFSAPAPGMDIEVHQKSANYYTYVLEYYSTSGIWKPFQNVVDPSDWMKNGPATLGVNPPVLYHLRWQLPADWDLMPLTIPTDPGPTTTITGAHMRSRIVTVLNVGPTQPPLARARGRSLDNAGGVMHLAQGIYSALTFTATVPAISDTTVQFFGGISHAGSMVVFPSATYSSSTTALQRLVFTPQLTINAGEALYITWNGGDKLQDVEMVLE